MSIPSRTLGGARGGSIFPDRSPQTPSSPFSTGFERNPVTVQSGTLGLEAQAVAARKGGLSGTVGG